MISFIMMVLGLGLIIWSLYLIRKDIEAGQLRLTRGIEDFGDSKAERILVLLDALETEVQQMNQSFYDLVSDLEGSFSVHDKELQLLTERFDKIEKQLGNITSEVKITHQPERNKPAVSKQMKAYVEQSVPPLKEVPSETQLEAKAILSLSPEESTAMKQRILALRKEGHSLAQIAKILNIGMGELQLFIKLNTK